MVNFGAQSADQWEMAAPAQALHEGDDVVAGSDAVAELEHFDGSLTRLDAGATAALRRIADPAGQAHVILDLGPGTSWHRTSPTRLRGGRYEARTPVASALARAAVFVVRRSDDGGAWFAVLGGTVIVRGRTGGMVVLRAGETVTATADGALGEVAAPGIETLDDEWVAVNRVLDADGIEPVGTGTPEAHPEPDPVEDTDDDGDREHPWRVGVAAGLALGLAVFSVVIGRAGTKQPAERTTGRDPAIAVPGPPAFATPAVTAPAVTAPRAPVVAAPSLPEADVADVAAPGVEQQATTAASGAVPTAEVTGKSCSRSGGVVVYSGSLHNHATTAATFRVHVDFITSSGEVVASAAATVTDVPADGTRSFRASAPAGRAAAACEVDRVEPVL